MKFFFFYLLKNEFFCIGYIFKFYSVRGTLGSLLMVCGNFGILIAFIAGHFLEFVPVAGVHIAFPALFVITLVLFPDTPYHFINFNQEEVTIYQK